MRKLLGGGGHRRSEGDIAISPYKQCVRLGNVSNSPVASLLTANVGLLLRKPQIFPSQIKNSRRRYIDFNVEVIKTGRVWRIHTYAPFTVNVPVMHTCTAGTCLFC